MKISPLSLAPISFECNGKVLDTFCIFNTEKLVSTGKFFLNKRIAGTFYARFKDLESDQYRNIYNYDEMMEIADKLTAGKIIAIPRQRVDGTFSLAEPYPHTIMWYDEEARRVFLGLGFCVRDVEITDLRTQVHCWYKPVSGPGKANLLDPISFEDVLKRNREVSGWEYYPEQKDPVWRKTNAS